jgi:hypothetical protein
MKRQSTNLKVVQVPPLQQHEAKISGEEVRAILKELMDRIEQTFAEAAFQFATSLEGNSGVWSKGPCIPEFVERLHPWLKEREQRVETVINAAGQGLSNDYDMIKWQHEETGYRLGILVGARLAGYSAEKVLEIGAYLPDVIT